MGKRRLAVSVFLVLAVSTCLATADEPRSFTVGDLSVRLAQRLRHDTGETTVDAALSTLAEAGVAVRGDLDRPVREADVAEILNQLGLNLVTSQPDRRVEAKQLDRLLGLLMPATEGRGGEPGVSTSDRGNNPPGGGYGRSKSKASPHN